MSFAARVLSLRKLIFSYLNQHAEVCEQWYNLWVDRPIPSYFTRIPLFDMSVTLVLTVALVYLWKDKLLG
jgi:hypothetical protein